MKNAINASAAISPAATGINEVPGPRSAVSAACTAVSKRIPVIPVRFSKDTIYITFLKEPRYFAQKSE